MNRDKFYPMLVIDAGNSSVKIARLDKPDAEPRILASLAHDDVTRLNALLTSDPYRMIHVACVVPQLAALIGELCPHATFINPKSKLNFETHVDRDTVGADRLANVAAAEKQFSKNVLVVDFGTATTFDFLNQKGVFSGGAITLGLHTMTQALSHATAQLPQASLDAPERFEGRNTAEALNAGVVGGFVGLIRHLVEQIAQENTRLVFTGGDAQRAQALCALPAYVDPLWTLRGIAILAELAL